VLNLLRQCNELIEQRPFEDAVITTLIFKRFMGTLRYVTNRRSRRLEPILRLLLSLGLGREPWSIEEMGRAFRRDARGLYRCEERR
jgi:hypothetical protein